MQDPGSFDERTQKVMREAMLLRYSLLPYLYTLFYHAHVHGNTVVRAIFHEYVLFGFIITACTAVRRCGSIVAKN